MEDVKEPRDQFDDKADLYEVEEVLNKKLATDMNYRHKYLWRRVLIHSTLQLSWLIGLYTMIFHTKLATIVWSEYQTHRGNRNGNMHLIALLSNARQEREICPSYFLTTSVSSF